MFRGFNWRQASEEGGGEYVGDQSSILSLQPWVFRKGDCGVDEERGEFSGRGDDQLSGFGDGNQTEFAPMSVKIGGGGRRGRSSVRSRRARRQVVSSTGNCLIPQLYDQHFEIDEYVFGSLSSEAALSRRPFVVTDGDRVISKANYVSTGKQRKNELRKEGGADLGDVGAVVGFTPLPARTPKRKSRDGRCEGSGASISRRCHSPFSSQGSQDRMLLFSLGVSFGVISTILSNRKEVEKLSNLLMDSENLVQDLQDELDMKESLTVKELVNEACESKELQDSYVDVKEATDSFHNQKTDHHDQPCVPKAVDNSDSMSKIEAELEAELERLEFNMSSSCREGKASSLDEFDPDLIGDVVHGELRADMFSGVQEGQGDLDRDSISSSTTDTHSLNYAVSPRELSLRLHELIQCRLEERIQELESELEHSQKHLQLVEAGRVLSQGTFSNSEAESTDQENLTIVEQDCVLAQPLHLNLAGDALNAYEEAYEELMRMPVTEETLPPVTDTKKKPLEDGLYSTNRSLVWGMEGDDVSKPLAEVEYINRELTWNQILSSVSDVEDCNGGDEYEIDDDEGRMIQQIVERTRQGSPAVLNAQKMLFSMDVHLRG